MSKAGDGKTASDSLARAIGLHQAGDLEQAQTLYRQLLQGSPDMPDVQYLLGLSCIQQELWQPAFESFAEAVRLRPGFIEAHLQQGKAAQRLGNFAQAVQSYQCVEVLDPSCMEAFVGLGQAENSLGLFDAALLSFARVLVIEPENLMALQGECYSLMHAGRNEEALQSMQLAYDIAPDSAEVNINLGAVLRALDRSEEALLCFDRTIALDRDAIAAHIHRGSVLIDLERYALAEASYLDALQIDQGSMLAHMGHGNALHHQGKESTAVDAYNRVLLLIPGHAEALFNRGVCLQMLNRSEEALVSYRDAVGADASYLTAINNLGNTQQALGLYSQALKSYRHAQMIDPDYADAHWNEAVCLLKTGDLASGWHKYEWRWHPELLEPIRKFGEAIRWDGHENLTGKRFLVTAEQGLGDTIQFCRYLPLLRDKGAVVTFVAPPSLLPVLYQMGGVTHLSGDDVSLAEKYVFDFEMPLLSLPGAFATTLATIPEAPDYLSATDLKTQQWSNRCGERRAVRIGVVIEGNRDNVNDAARSLPAAMLEGVLRTDVEWFCLQREISEGAASIMAHHNMRHFRSALTDFAETAGFINNMDIVISVDTSVAHMAAAMGKPTWILLAHNADFRWLIGRSDSPWYPSVQLFRQRQPSDWSSVMTEVGQRLSAYMDGMSLGITRRQHLTPTRLGKSNPQ